MDNLRLVLNKDTLDSLVSLSRLRTSQAPLVVIESDVASLALSAATALGRAWLGDTLELDLHLAVPSGDRWSVAELSALVVEPTRLVALERTVVVVDRADLMDPLAAYRLLKVVEEPPSLASFIFCVTRASNLLTTISGRASQVLRLDPAPLEVRARLLVATGVPADAARRALELAGSQVGLAPVLAGNPDLMEAFERAASLKLPVAQPASEAARTVAALEALAREVVKKDAQKALVRTLVRELVTSYRKRTHARVLAASSPTDLKQVVALTEALDLSLEQLSRYTTPVSVLGALYS